MANPHIFGLNSIFCPIHICFRKLKSVEIYLLLNIFRSFLTLNINHSFAAKYVNYQIWSLNCYLNFLCGPTIWVTTCISVVKILTSLIICMSIQTCPLFMCFGLFEIYVVDICQLSSSGSNGTFTPLLVDVEFVGTIGKSRTISGVWGASLL